MNGRIFDLARYCLHDGPGIRTTVFFKGCPLDCVWCHNPESKKAVAEILYAAKNCLHCGRCAAICPQDCHKMAKGHTFDRSLCKGCGLCARNCPADALRLAGREVSAEEVIEEVLKDRAFYQESEGGLTVSGGEPLMQIDFLQSLLALAKEEGLHTCIETCGYAPWAHFERILPLTDCFLFDWKESDPEKHRQFTGKDQALILENLRRLDQEGARVILRIPLIPGYNDTLEHQEGIAALVKSCSCIEKIQIMPYHPLGVSKAEELGQSASMDASSLPDQAFLQDFAARLQEKSPCSVEFEI